MNDIYVVMVKYAFIKSLDTSCGDGCFQRIVSTGSVWVFAVNLRNVYQIMRGIDASNYAANEHWNELLYDLYEILYINNKQ